MKTKEKTTIDPCDVVVVRDKVYRVEAAMPGRPCASQCHLYDHDAERCPGTCYRWTNMDDIVFRCIMPAKVLAGDAVVCVTPMWREWEEKRRLEATGRQEAYRERKKEGAEPRKVGRKSTGGIEELKGMVKTYRAQIIIDGMRYRYSSTDRAKVEAWLEEKRKEAER